MSNKTCYSQITTLRYDGDMMANTLNKTQHNKENFKIGKFKTKFLYQIF